jgi:hypothetical protein
VEIAYSTDKLRLEEKAMRGYFKANITVNFIIVAVCLAVSQSSAVEFAGGTGQPNNPYQIATAEQLISIGSNLNLLEKHFVLLNDIDLDPNLPGGKVFIESVIAPDVWMDYGDYRAKAHFSGSLDGNGHRIMNMVIKGNAGDWSENIGLIGYLYRDSIVKNIELRNIKISVVGQQVGGLVGFNEGKVLRCSVTGSITGVSCVGGLVGTNGCDNIGDIIACSAFCNVKAVPGQFHDYGGTVGGLVGYNVGYIFNCCAIGTVTGDSGLGGLVGANAEYISNCYAMGTIVGGGFVGGMIGDNWGAVSQCYAACEIITDSNDSIGGLIGESDGQTTGSFWDVQVSGQKISAGGVGLSTSELRETETYLNAGWDMTGEASNGIADIWTIAESNNYPQLTRLTGQYTVTQLPGSGTADDPYKIATTEELVAINDYDTNAHYALVADIDMSNMVWAAAPIFFFNGTFDGQGYTIYNLNINGGDYLGLFGKINRSGIVNNLTIHDAYINGHKYIGALSGMSYGQITNCHVTGNITGVSYVGGLVGLVCIPFFPGNNVLEDYVSDCTADVVLSGNEFVNNIANVEHGCS